MKKILCAVLACLLLVNLCSAFAAPIEKEDTDALFGSFNSTLPGLFSYMGMDDAAIEEAYGFFSLSFDQEMTAAIGMVCYTSPTYTYTIALPITKEFGIPMEEFNIMTPFTDPASIGTIITPFLNYYYAIELGVSTEEADGITGWIAGGPAANEELVTDHYLVTWMPMDTASCIVFERLYFADELLPTVGQAAEAPVHTATDAQVEQAVSNAQSLMNGLEAPDTLVIKGDILVMDNEGEDVYVITYAAKDASGASVTGNAIFNAGGYVCDEEELEGITDRLEAMVDGETDRDRAQELRFELMEYLGLSVCVSYCRLNGEYETVSGAYVAEQLGVQYE